MEQNLLIMAQLSDLCNWLNRSHLIVSKHNGYECCILSDCILHIFDIYDAVRLWLKQCNLKAFLLQFCQSVKDSMMLDVERNQVLLALLNKTASCRNQCLVVCFASAGSEVNLIRLGSVDSLSHLSSGFIQLLLSDLPICMKTVRIAVVILETIQQCIECDIV